MNLGQQIAASTVLIAFFALFIFSGRKPLPPVPKTQVVVEENQEKVEEEQPIATEVEVQTDEQVTRSRGRVAAPLTPPMPPPMPAPNSPPMPAPGIFILPFSWPFGNPTLKSPASPPLQDHQASQSAKHMSGPA